MLYIDPNTIQARTARERHFDKMRCYVMRKLGENGCRVKSCSICYSRIEKLNDLPESVWSFLSDECNLAEILTGDPETLLSVNDRFWLSIFPNYNYETWKGYFKKDRKYENEVDEEAGEAELDHTVIQTREITRILNEALNYKWFSQKAQKHYNAYQLTKSLRRDTCTYCNRAYTNTIIRQIDAKPIIRPTLDHWFPKYNHPLLAVSFYNLVPSCPTCNSYIKGTNLESLDKVIHPYVDPLQTSDFEFAYFFENSLSQYQIFIRNLSSLNNKAVYTLNQMYMGTIYQAHEGDLNDLLTIQKNYSGSYIDSIKKLLGGKLTTSEIYKIAFGTEHKEKDFYKRPLSKFKHDILRQMGLLQTDE
jgi:hypothetical protein